MSPPQEVLGCWSFHGKNHRQETDLSGPMFAGKRYTQNIAAPAPSFDPSFDPSLPIFHPSRASCWRKVGLARGALWLTDSPLKNKRLLEGSRASAVDYLSTEDRLSFGGALGRSRDLYLK
jgi:hypothetical protein